MKLVRNGSILFSLIHNILFPIKHLELLYAQKKIILLYPLSAKKRSNQISMNTDTTSTVVLTIHCPN